MRNMIAALLLGGSSPALADTAPNLPLVPYENQGSFVVEPAKFIASPVYGAGFLVGAFACLPISLVQVGSSEGKTPHEKEASLVCGKYVGTAVGWPVYLVAGLPFYVLKETFWEAPKAVARLLRHAPKAEPVPASAQ
ncbi:MAG: hypothetical protein HY077_02550 [Elusimicrobia bacterium]|nr:hypothetical protein [Elusimicrobiota bacterium]